VAAIGGGTAGELAEEGVVRACGIQGSRTETEETVVRRFGKKRLDAAESM